MYEEIIISDWKDIEELEINFPCEIFRGQSDASWELSSSLNRFANGTDAGDDICNTEFWFLRTFRRRASHYISNLPENNDVIGWLSLMQHYGTPTRLIDFSHSFYVACYFALINAKQTLPYGQSIPAGFLVKATSYLELGSQAYVMNVKTEYIKKEIIF